jgi:hypothetical protein
MRVNSAFTGFFTNRLVAGSGIAMAMLAIVLTASSFTPRAGRESRARQVNLMIRQTGHQLLLQAGDSTSGVLPVTEVKDGTFVLRFENEFVFNHDSLLLLSQRLLPKAEFPSGYTVTVHDCLTGGIVYGFQVNNTSPDILACSGRRQPSGCYTIEFAFPDFYAKADPKKANLESPGASAGGDTQVVNQNFEKLITASFDADIEPRNEIVTTTSFDFPWIHVVYGAILVLLSTTLLMGHFREKSKPVDRQNQNSALASEPIPELAALGSFLFNIKAQHLLLGGVSVTLTDKECRVLELLHKNFGELTPRETLMQEVWINEGVFTGRSLDMFVSKLRKKLSLDPGLKITNVHGKGYRLEMSLPG